MVSATESVEVWKDNSLGWFPTHSYIGPDSLTLDRDTPTDSNSKSLFWRTEFHPDDAVEQILSKKTEIYIDSPSVIFSPISPGRGSCVWPSLGGSVNKTFHLKTGRSYHGALFYHNYLTNEN